MRGNGDDGAATVTGILSAGGRWNPALLGAVRVVAGLLWIQNLAWKVPPDFGHDTDPPEGLYEFIRAGVEHPVFGPYSWALDEIVLPNFHAFAWGVFVVEGCLGAFLLVGLLTRLFAAIGIAQSLAITLSVLYAPGEWFWAYFLMLALHAALLATAAGHAYGVDSALWSARRRRGDRAGRLPRDRAAIGLGVGAIAGTVFAFADDLPWRLVRLEGWGVAVTLLLALVAIAAGMLSSRALAAVAGVGFLVASVLAAVQLTAQEGSGGTWLGGDGSTVAFLLGFAVGLLALATARD